MRALPPGLELGPSSSGRSCVGPAVSGHGTAEHSASAHFGLVYFVWSIWNGTIWPSRRGGARTAGPRAAPPVRGVFPDAAAAHGPAHQAQLRLAVPRLRPAAAAGPDRAARGRAGRTPAG